MSWKGKVILMSQNMGLFGWKFANLLRFHSSNNNGSPSGLARRSIVPFKELFAQGKYEN